MYLKISEKVGLVFEHPYPEQLNGQPMCFFGNEEKILGITKTSMPLRKATNHHKHNNKTVGVQSDLKLRIYR